MTSFSSLVAALTREARILCVAELPMQIEPPIRNETKNGIVNKSTSERKHVIASKKVMQLSGAWTHIAAMVGVLPEASDRLDDSKSSSVPILVDGSIAATAAALVAISLRKHVT